MQFCLGNLNTIKRRLYEDEREEAEMTPKSQIDPLAERPLAIIPGRSRWRMDIDAISSSSFCSCPSLSADLFWSSSILQAGNLFIGQCRAVLTEDNPLYTSPLLQLLSLFAGGTDGPPILLPCNSSRFGPSPLSLSFLPLTPNLPATFDALRSIGVCLPVLSFSHRA